MLQIPVLPLEYVAFGMVVKLLAFVYVKVVGKPRGKVIIGDEAGKTVIVWALVIEFPQSSVTDHVLINV